MGAAAFRASARQLCMDIRKRQSRQRLAHHKNPTRRWRYKNKTNVLFSMDSGINSIMAGRCE